jgi:hypothetical protein
MFRVQYITNLKLSKRHALDIATYTDAMKPTVVAKTVNNKP